MYLRFLSGRYAGKVRNVAPVPARVLLADGRAELEYPNQLSAFKPVAAGVVVAVQLPVREPAAVEAVVATPAGNTHAKRQEPHEVPRGRRR